MNFDENERYHYSEWTDHSIYIPSYYAEVEHLGLNRRLLLKDFDKDNLHARIKEQLATWETIWQSEQYKIDTKPINPYSHELADQLTALAKSNLKLVKDILMESLNTDIELIWNQLKDHSTFPNDNPESSLLAEIDRVPFPTEPLFKDLPNKPKEEDFEPKLSFFDRLLGSGAKRKKAEAQEAYQSTYARWEEEVAKIEAENLQLGNDYLAKLADAEAQKNALMEKSENQVNSWHKEYKEFTDRKNKYNEAVTQWEIDFQKGKEEAVLNYYDYILHYSAYPDFVSKIFKLQYRADEKLLVIDYLIPAPGQVPRVSEVRFIPPRGILKDYPLSDRQFSRVYNDAIYKMVLRTAYEVFKTDFPGNIDQFVYNGWVRHTHEGEGLGCLVSMNVSKADFNSLNLEHIEPQRCFQDLKGRTTEDLTLLNSVEPWIETGFTL